MKKIVIGTRKSALAKIQAEMVRAYIRETYPDWETELLPLQTDGDRILDQPLEKIGGKGLFVKELDLALLDGRSDLSVHSLKDVPMEIAEELPLVAFSSREDARDVLVLPEGKTEPDFSLPVGCSSRRRMAQFQLLYPQAQFRTIRGNVQTRLQKLDAGEYGAILLAAAGLKRLGLSHRISRYFTTEEMIPAAGQGILAVQGRAGGDYRYLDGFSDKESRVCALAERAFVRALGGDCSAPVAAYAETENEKVLLSALYADEKNGRIYKDKIEGSIQKPEDAGRLLARQFQKQIEAGRSA